MTMNSCRANNPPMSRTQKVTSLGGSLMRYGVDSFSPSSYEPQEKGMMNIAARFSLSKKPRFIDPKGKKPIRLKVMPASLRQLQIIYRASRPSFALRTATWNLYTTQPNTLLPTYDEIVNLTGLL
jgi:hypothetical protein